MRRGVEVGEGAGSVKWMIREVCMSFPGCVSAVENGFLLARHSDDGSQVGMIVIHLEIVTRTDWSCRCSVGACYWFVIHYYCDFGHGSSRCLCRRVGRIQGTIRNSVRRRGYRLCSHPGSLPGPADRRLYVCHPQGLPGRSFCPHHRKRL